MTQRLEQTQAAIQTQQLATLQVAVAKMVELSVAELENRVQDEMLDNAALEEKDNDDFPVNDHTDNADTDTDNDAADDDNGDATPTDDNAYEESEFYGSEADAMGDYFSADDVPDYLQQRADEQRDRNELQYSGSTSFYEELQNQISEHDLNEHEREVMEYLIGSLDEDGFLRKDLESLTDELAIYHNILTDAKELERLIGILQEFEPRGIGARSLQECLHIQLTDPERRTPYTKIALEIIDHYFKEFTGRHWEIIRQRLELDEDTEEHVRYLLTHLNPRPGSASQRSLNTQCPGGNARLFCNRHRRRHPPRVAQPGRRARTPGEPRLCRQFEAIRQRRQKVDTRTKRRLHLRPSESGCGQKFHHPDSAPSRHAAGRDACHCRCATRFFHQRGRRHTAETPDAERHSRKSGHGHLHCIARYQHKICTNRLRTLSA